MGADTFYLNGLGEINIRENDYLTDDLVNLRREVFVDEQGFSWDLDSFDAVSTHFSFYLGKQIIATARCFNFLKFPDKLPNLFFDSVPADFSSIFVLGRLAIAKPYRNWGLGRKMLKYVEDFLISKNASMLILHAQADKLEFYTKSGFSVISDFADEDGCQHIWLGKNLSYSAEDRSSNYHLNFAENQSISLRFSRLKQASKNNLLASWQGRKSILQRLATGLKEHEADICDALATDLHKSAYEVKLAELVPVFEEISFMLKKADRFTGKRKISFAPTFFPGKAEIYNKPYGVVLIISPWNYPVNLALIPLIGAIAAGNTVALKPSEFTPATNAVLREILSEFSAMGLIDVFEGDASTAKILLDLSFDYIFFTGNSNIGKEVMKAAGKNLVPVTLELGGKSPCIVNEDADLQLAARRILFGKLLNAGQTCVAPDFVYVRENVKTEFIDILLKTIREMIPDFEYWRNNFPTIINEKHYKRLCGYLNEGRIIDSWPIAIEHVNDFANERLLPVCIIDSLTDEDSISHDEIFGPFLPILDFSDEVELINSLQAKPKPLALYIFSQNREFVNKVVEGADSGGVAVNDTIFHMSSNKLPFGGVGRSGMGQYHGYASLKTFTRPKTMLFASQRFEFTFRNHPYNKRKNSLLTLFRKFL